MKSEWKFVTTLSRYELRNLQLRNRKISPVFPLISRRQGITYPRYVFYSHRRCSIRRIRVREDSHRQFYDTFVNEKELLLKLDINTLQIAPTIHYNIIHYIILSFTVSIRPLIHSN